MVQGVKQPPNPTEPQVPAWLTWLITITGLAVMVLMGIQCCAGNFPAV